MNEVQSAIVDHSGEDERTVSLLSYSTSDDILFSEKNKYNYLIVPIDGSWTDNTLLISLENIGVNIDKLLSSPAADFRPSLPCFVTDEITEVSNLSFGRLVILELSDSAQETLPENIWTAFQSLSIFVDKDKSNSALLPIDEKLSEAYQNHTLRMGFYSAMSLAARYGWKQVSIAGKTDNIDTLSTEFQNHVEKYNAVYTTSFDARAALRDAGITPKEKQIKSSSILTDRQLKAIKSYTTLAYSQINSALRNGNIFSYEYIEIQATIEALSTALYFLPNEINPKCYRKFNPWSGAEEIYATGKDVFELAYTSTSRRDLIYFGKWNLIIDGLLGKFIAPYSAYPIEDEILFDKNFNHIVYSNEIVDDDQYTDLLILSKERLMNNFELKSYTV